jgi:hypothetical protein
LDTIVAFVKTLVTAGDCDPLVTGQEPAVVIGSVIPAGGLAKQRVRLTSAGRGQGTRSRSERAIVSRSSRTSLSDIVHLQTAIVVWVCAGIESELGDVMRQDRAGTGVDIPRCRISAIVREDDRAIGVRGVPIPARDGQTQAVAVGLNEHLSVALRQGRRRGQGQGGKKGQESEHRERHRVGQGREDPRWPGESEDLFGGFIM